MLTSKGRRISKEKSILALKIMALYIHTILLMISIMLPSSFLYICAARDTITTGSSFSGINNDTLISAGERFELGFFNPQHGNGWYIGIWYYKDRQTVVWIANRDNPLSNHTGVFVIGEDDNLNVLDGNNNPPGSGGSLSRNGTVKLLDSGNLVLSDDQSKKIWQSFDHPTDTFLPGMKMDGNLNLTSWTSDDDPRSGKFTFQQDPDVVNRFSIFINGSSPYWKSEDTGSFISATEMSPVAAYLLSNFSSPADLSNQNKNNLNQTRYVSLTNGTLVPARDFNNTRLLMNATGQIQLFRWYIRTGWSLIWSEPRDRCSVYKACGNFAICNSTSVPLCKCLPAFKPIWQDKWDSGDFSDGCTRKTTNCSNTFSNLKVMTVRKPTLENEEVYSEQECKEKCLAKKCECQAYMCEANSKKYPEVVKRRCWIWNSELYSLREDPEGGHNLSVRDFISDTGEEPKRAEWFQKKRTSTSYKTVVIFTIVIAVVLLISGIIYISYRRVGMIRQGNRASNQGNRASNQGNAELRLYDTENQNMAETQNMAWSIQV